MLKRKEKRTFSWIVALAMFFSMVLQPVIPVLAADEVVVLNEGFNSYKGTDATKPVGWTFNSIGFYDTISSSGKADKGGSGPNSLKFASNGSQAITPDVNLPNGGKLSFWMKGMSAVGEFLIESFVNGNWVTLEKITTLPSTDTIKEYNLQANSTKVRFTYTKTTSNVALDDVKITSTGAVEIVPVTSIQLSQDKLELEVDQTSLLGVTFNPEDTTQKSIQWSSEDPAVASVTNGTVTGLKEGTTTITATSTDNPEVKATCEVTVKAKPDTSGPVVLTTTPVSGSTTENNRPEISATFEDVSGVDNSSIKLYFNDVEVTSKATITEGKISYKPEINLSESTHNVRLIIKDTLGNETVKEWSFTVGKVESNLYYGQLHAHTNISDGVGTLDDAYTHARDMGHADYIAITDHSNWFDNDTKGNILDGSASTEWTSAHATADKYNKDNEFVAIYGYEMTWSGSTGGWGHINTFNTPGFETRTNSKMDLKTYYDTLLKVPQSVSQLNHPGKTFGDFGDFGFYNKAVDQYVTLIEVGNGEGPVRGTGYFPSYEYYTRALDKGWHVAPTNNQDNHKGAWITANSARTVIDAPSLTRDSLYQSMRDMKVFSTEDSNLRINYTVNDMPMGSKINPNGKLNFKISVVDPDGNDSIGKISIIANGGAVVASKTFDSNDVQWNFELDNTHTYYYVRVDEKDKDIAVTAPVWTAETVAVGISGLACSSEIVYPNENVTFKATLFNNDAKAYNDVKVEYFLNDATSENKIGEITIPTLEAAKTAFGTFDYKFTKVGEQAIYAKTTINVSGSDKTSTASVKVNVVNSEDVVKVMIDGAHQNQYITGDYKDKYNGFKDVLLKNGARVVVNDKPITDEVLDGVSLLVLTDPQSKDKSTYGLTPKLYSDEEVEAIKNFVDKGGNIIITSRADYDDKGITNEIYESANQGNKVLEGIGANLRFNDDEVIDDVSNGGQNFRLYFNKFLSPKYNLTKDLPEGLTYSAYSGCSVILKPNGDDTNVDWIIKGHDTTAILDSDLQNDATPVDKGNVYSLAAEVLPSGSKIVVAGTTFFSDFEVSGDDLYANGPLSQNIVKWMAPAKEAEFKKIAEIRQGSSDVPDLKGKRFTIEGTVTAQSEAVEPKNAFFEVIYVQDDTAGITVFGVSQTAVKVGQKVRITGYVDDYQGDYEIAISDESKDLVIIDETINEIEPLEVPTEVSMMHEMEGQLLKVTGKVVKMDAQNIYIKDMYGAPARVYVEGYIWDGINPDNKGKWDPAIKVGDTVSAIGLASQDPEGNRLRVRNTSEIVRIKDGSIAPIIINLDNGEELTKEILVNALSNEKEIHIVSKNTTIMLTEREMFEYLISLEQDEILINISDEVVTPDNFSELIQENGATVASKLIINTNTPLAEIGGMVTVKSTVDKKYAGQTLYLHLSNEISIFPIQSVLVGENGEVEYPALSDTSVLLLDKEVTYMEEPFLFVNLLEGEKLTQDLIKQALAEEKPILILSDKAVMFIDDMAILENLASIAEDEFEFAFEDTISKYDVVAQRANEKEAQIISTVNISVKNVGNLKFGGNAHVALPLTEKYTGKEAHVYRIDEAGNIYYVSPAEIINLDEIINPELLSISSLADLSIEEPIEIPTVLTFDISEPGEYFIANKDNLEKAPIFVDLNKGENLTKELIQKALDQGVTITLEGNNTSIIINEKTVLETLLTLSNKELEFKINNTLDNTDLVDKFAKDNNVTILAKNNISTSVENMDFGGKVSVITSLFGTLKGEKVYLYSVSNGKIEFLKELELTQSEILAYEISKTGEYFIANKLVTPNNGGDNGNNNGGNTGNNGTTTVDNNKEEIIEAIKDNNITNIIVDASKNSSVSKEIFDAIKGTDKTITFTNGNVTWTFNGKDIAQTMNIDLSVNVISDTLKANINNLVERILDKEAPAFMLSFKYDGELPGKAQIKVFMGMEWANKTVTFFRYFPDKNTYEKVQENVKVDKDGYATITLDHCSDYFALEQTTNVKALPQAGSPFGASNVLAIGLLLSALGVVALRRRKTN